MRLGGPGDVTGIARVHLATRRSAYREMLPAPVLAEMNEVSLVDWWQRRLATAPRPNRLLVAVECQPSTELLGFAHVGPGDAGQGELYAIHVHPLAQGMGVGMRLLDAALNALHDLGYHRAELWVLDGNLPAQGFYRRHGWQPVDGMQREVQIGGASVSEVVYRRDLPLLQDRLAQRRT